MTDKNVCRCHLGLESAGILRASSGSTSLSLGRERRWGPGIGCPGRAAAPLAGRLDCRRGAGGGGCHLACPSFPASGGTPSPSTHRAFTFSSVPSRTARTSDACDVSNDAE